MQRLHSPKSEHRSIPSSHRKVAVLGAIIGVPAVLLLVDIAQLIRRCLVGAKSISDDGFRRAVALELSS